MSLNLRNGKASCVKLLNDNVKIYVKNNSYQLRRLLESIESLTKKKSKHLNRCHLAQILHQHANTLKLQGDYETALILYHRAATIYPRNIAHNIAACHTSVVIHSTTNPQGVLCELMYNAKNSISLIPALYPETAALRAQQLLNNSNNFDENTKKILQYIDICENPTGKNLRKKRINKRIRSKMEIRQFSGIAVSKLCEMKKFFNDGDWKTTINVGNEFLLYIGGHEHHYCYRVHRYMALSHLSLGRHDRAISEVTRMIQAAKKTNDIKLLSRSFAVLGRVHLTFGHVNAVARAWQQLSYGVNRPVLKAWLHHEIGRCYFEMSDFSKALKMSRRCIDSSELANSIKWMCYGKLLNGQTLIELGHLTEAFEALEFVLKIAKKQINDLALINYVEGLVISVGKVLRQNSQGEINKSKNFINKSTTFEISNGNVKNVNVNVCVPSLKTSLTKQNSIDLSADIESRGVFSHDTKEQKKYLKNICTMKDNTIVTEKKSVSRSCHVIDKWKNSFCNGKKILQQNFDLINSTSNDIMTISENDNLSSRTHILCPIGDTPKVENWIYDEGKSKKNKRIHIY